MTNCSIRTAVDSSDQTPVPRPSLRASPRSLPSLVPVNAIPLILVLLRPKTEVQGRDQKDPVEHQGPPCFNVLFRVRPFIYRADVQSVRFPRARGIGGIQYLASYLHNTQDLSDGLVSVKADATYKPGSALQPRLVDRHKVGSLACQP